MNIVAKFWDGDWAFHRRDRYGRLTGVVVPLGIQSAAIEHHESCDLVTLTTPDITLYEELTIKDPGDLMAIITVRGDERKRHWYGSGEIWSIQPFGDVGSTMRFSVCFRVSQRELPPGGIIPS